MLFIESRDTPAKAARPFSLSARVCVHWTCLRKCQNRFLQFTWKCLLALSPRSCRISLIPTRTSRYRFRAWLSLLRDGCRAVSSSWRRTAGRTVLIMELCGS
ncbi:hypothetical protein BT93_I0773 [Corymbia citriodora subsp. variegata]|nr:hypothetical protein BT93_I0773 [Corymbia citriodora subsp. variegata]